ncbi:MAG: tetratricopeptide repeat protein [Pirellulales bacterium]
MRFALPNRLLFVALIGLWLALNSIKVSAQDVDSSEVARKASDKKPEATEKYENEPNTQRKSAQSEADDDLLQERRAAEKFFELLEKNPRRGTAFDRVYSHHADYGTLEKLLENLRERTKQNADDSVSWQIQGLIELHRGRFPVAAQAFSQSEKLRSTDPIASYYLGLALSGASDWPAAIDAMNRALERKPARADSHEIHQQLGRLYLKATRFDKALEIWDRLESQYPNDPRVVEEVATILVQEGRLDLAKARYEKLLKIERDDFRRSTVKLQIADLTGQLGERAGGIAQLEQVLGELNPTSWLFRDARRRIDELFLKSKDQEGLVKYYQSWLSKHPDDLDAMMRLARFLASVARMEEAIQWNAKAIELAPNQVDLRKSYVDLLAEARKYNLADEQYRELVKLEPTNIDNLRKWGSLMLQHADKPESERVQSALQIWQKIVDSAPKDPVIISQVAELCLQNRLSEPAEKYLRQAVSVAPKLEQYREYLAEFLFRSKRNEEAIAIWQELIDVPNPSVDSLRHAAEMFSKFSMYDHSAEVWARAVKLEPKDFHLQLQAAKSHYKNQHIESANLYLQAAEGLAGDQLQRDLVIAEMISQSQASRKLPEEIQQLQQQVAKLNEEQSTTAAAVQLHYKFARFLEANRQWGLAMDEAKKATSVEPAFVQGWELAARVAEVLGDKKNAIETLRKLAALDRRSRNNYWIKVSELELKTGNSTGALEAAQSVIESAPSMVSSYEFYAQMCVKIGKLDEAVTALRKAMRIDPKDVGLLFTLGKILSDAERTQEAIDVYFRVLEKSDELDDMLDVVNRLTPLFTKSGGVEELTSRLDAERKLPGMNRSRTICLAQVWASTNQLPKARQALESLLQSETRDTVLLNQLAKLCRQSNDLSAAISYQRRLVEIAPGSETEVPLAKMLLENGNSAEGHQIIVNHVLKERDPVRQMAELDSLIHDGNYVSASHILNKLLEKNSDDWELLYRSGVVNLEINKSDEAIEQFKHLFSLNLPLETLSREVVEEQKLATKRPGGSSQTNAHFADRDLRDMDMVVAHVQSDEMMKSVRSVNRSSVNAAQLRTARQGMKVFLPRDYAEARIAVLAKLETRKLAAEEFLKQIEPETKSNLLAAYDQLTWAIAKNDSESEIQWARRIAELGDDHERMLFLQAIQRKCETPSGQPISLTRGSSTVTGTLQSITGVLVSKILTPSELQFAWEQFQKSTPKMKYAQPRGGILQRTMANRVLLNPIRNSNFVVYANGSRVTPGSTTTRTLNLADYSPPSLFLLEQARMHKNEELVQAIQADILENCSQPELIMVVILTRLNDKPNEDLSALWKRWREICQSKPAAQPSVLSTAYMYNVYGYGYPSGQGIGEGRLMTLIPYFIQQKKYDEVDQIVHEVIPLFWRISRSQPQQSTAQRSAILGQIALSSARASGTGNLSFSQAALTQRYDLEISEIVHGMLEQNGTSDRLQTLFKKFHTDEPNEDLKVCWLSNRANLQMLSRDFEAAAESLKTICERVPDDVSFQFARVRALELNKQLDDALSLVASITVDETNKPYRDLKIIELSMALGRSDVAKDKVNALAKQSLPVDAMNILHSKMLMLGMRDEAAELAKSIPKTIFPAIRTTRTTTIRPGASTATQQMAQAQAVQAQMQQQQLQMEQMRQQQMALLMKTISETNCLIDANDINKDLLLALSEHASYGRASNSNTASESYRRKYTLFSLAQSGDLIKMIQGLEADLLSNPDQDDKLRRLAEYKICHPGQDPVPTLRELVLKDPKSRAYRFLLAACLEVRQKDEAFELYEALLSEHAEWTCEKLMAIDSKGYANAKQKETWLKALLKVDPGSLHGSALAIDFCKSLLRGEKTADQGIELFEHLSKGYSKDTTKLLTLFTDSQSLWWENGKFVDIAFSKVLPDSQQIKADRFMGSEWLTAGIEHDSSQIPASWKSPFEKMLTAVSYEKSLGWRGKLKSHIEANPDWMLGPMLLLQTELHLGLDKEAVEVADKLIRAEFIDQIENQSLLRWYGFRAFENRKGAVEGELRVVEKLLDSSLGSDRQVFSRLLELCAKSEPNQTIRDTLVRRVQASSKSIWRRLEIAEVQIQLELYLDAVRNMSSLPTSQQRSTQSYMNLAGTQLIPRNQSSPSDSQDGQSRANLLLIDAITKSLKAGPSKILAPQLFVNVDGQTRLTDLLTIEPMPSQIFTADLQSVAVEQFLKAAGSEGSSMLEQLKATLSTADPHPDAMILELIWQLKQKSIAANELAEKLDKLTAHIQSRPPDLIDPMSIYMLTARLFEEPSIIGDPAIRERANKLSKSAVDVVKIHSSVDLQVIVLAGLSKLFAKHQPDQVESLCSEMLDSIRGSDQYGLRQTTKVAEPLTMPQFKQALALSRFAAENDLKSVQLNVLRLALVDRVPPITPELSRELRSLVDSLNTQKESVEVFEILKETVFITRPIKQLHFHASMVDQKFAIIDNLAERFVAYAAKLNQLDALAELTNRQDQDQASQLSMGILIDLARSDENQVHEKLATLKVLILNQRKSSYDNLPVLVAASKAAKDRNGTYPEANEILTQLGVTFVGR